MMRRCHLLFQGDSKDVVGSLAAAIAQMPQATVPTPTTGPSHVSGRVSASNSYLPFDPLGGMDHRDYIRDLGGVPHYAPRNVTDGGRFSFQHAGSPLSAGISSTPLRSVDVTHIQNESRRLREMSRAGYDLDPGASTPPQAVVGNTEDWFLQSVAKGGLAQSPATQWARQRDASVVTPASVSGQQHLSREMAIERRNASDRELLYHIHGFHDHDKKEADFKQSRANTNFDGYDSARNEASKSGKFFFSSPRNSPLVPPASYSEAQQNLHAKSLSPEDEHRQKLYQDSQNESPMFGEDLTKHVVKGMQRFTTQDTQARERERSDEFGLGRQTPLVSDSGPDQRNFKMHKNDERYLSAAKYNSFAYKMGVFGPEDLPESPYERRRLPINLYQSRFDMDRRSSKVAKGEYDIFDSQSVYLGVPMKSQIDKRVLEKKNARGERPMEYYMPFPRPQDMLLQAVYSDTAGMYQIGKAKASKEEWGLFMRYREHWYQRRTLALRHGLEPAVNENITQRDERRAKLDSLCARTAFVDPQRSDVDIPDASALRSWFGDVLPCSSTLHGQPLEDRDEVILSISYLKTLLINSGPQDPLRVQVSQTLLKAPQCTPKYAQPPEVLSRLSAEQRKRYDEYIQLEVNRHKEKWDNILQQRKYVASLGCFATRDKANVANDSEKKVVSVKLEDGTTTEVSSEEWSSAPLEAVPHDPNLHINWGMPATPYMNQNYVEAQDYLWEQRVYNGTEGWSPAARSDNLSRGHIVMARRDLFEGRKGDWEKAVVMHFDTAPYYNPKGEEKVSVKFLGDGHLENVSLSEVLLWQLHWSHPRRLQPLETKKHTGGLRRYINMRDPKGSIRRGTKPHFLDAFLPPDQRHPFQSITQITELDGWYRWDYLRADNYRRLTINDRKDYLIGSYYHKYTPWDIICHQEDDQPLLFFDNHYISDDVGLSYFTNQARFWKNKRRPVAYIRNYREELKDFFGHVDAKVPWNKARYIVPVWEVRKHHPVAQLHSNALAPHRNHVGMLPMKSWDIDRKTGQITNLREDDIKEYVATHPGSENLVDPLKA